MIEVIAFRRSYAASLSRHFGGRWKYDGMASWRCDDKIRHVSRVHTGGYDIIGEPLPGFGYFLYERGKAPVRVYFGGRRVATLHREDGE